MNVSDQVTSVPKRVLYTITLSEWGGAQKYVFDLTLAARARGDTVQVIIGGEGELMRQLSGAGIDFVSLDYMRRGINPFNEVRTLLAFIRIIQTFKPDVVHSNSSKAGLLGGLAAHFLRVPHIFFTCHGWAFNETGNIAKKILYWLFHYATVISNQRTICVSQAIYRDALSMPFIRNKLVVIHLGVQESDLLSTTDARTQLLPEYPHTALWIGAVGRLDPVKQHDILIHAFAKVHQQFPEVLLLIIGEGSERQTLEATIRRYSLQDRVFLCGHKEDAQRYMRAFDIFAFPSYSESFGFAAVEAGLAGLPVVASNVGGLPEIITSGENGILIPRQNIDALADALSTLIQDSELRNKYGATLREKVLKEFTKPQMIEKTFALYR